MMFFFFFTDPATTDIYTLSLHDALPISIIFFCSNIMRIAQIAPIIERVPPKKYGGTERVVRSEEHTSELQSHSDLVCRLLLEKKNKCKDSASPRPRQPERIGFVTHDIVP